LKKLAFVRALGALAVLVATLVAGPARADSPNLLTDPSFEEGKYHVSMSNFIANGWSYWYESRAADDPRGWWLPEPEFGIIADRAGQAHDGAMSQRWFNSWAIHNAGVYQRVAVTPGSWLRFSIWMFNWSSQNDDFGVSEGYHHKWVGIDPTGGTDALGPNVIWGNEDRTMDVWVQLGVIAQAQADHVTVFVRERPEYSIKHNDVLIDDASLFVIPDQTAPVVQPVANATRKASDNDKPENAVAISRVPTSGTIASGDGSKYLYFKFEYAGGDLKYKINVQATPDDGNVLKNVTFRVYGPNGTKVYAKSGYQKGLRPNVVADLGTSEPGTYVVQLANSNPGTPVDYRIWLTGKGLVGEVAESVAPTSAPAAPVVPAPAPAPVAPVIVP
jgi:hypothetical protein